jgi:hypothetical protein
MVAAAAAAAAAAAVVVVVVAATPPMKRPVSLPLGSVKPGEQTGQTRCALPRSSESKQEAVSATFSSNIGFDLHLLTIVIAFVLPLIVCSKALQLLYCFLQRPWSP